MGNLIKYEFRKTWIIKAIILVFTAIFELLFLAGTFSKNEDMQATGIIFLILTTLCALFIIGIYGIFRLHKDITTKQSYMLFMTPHNSYTILGAKLIENAGSILLAGVFYMVLALIDITFLAAYNGEIVEALDLINEILGEHYSIDTYRFIMISFDMITVWIFNIVTGFFAVTISASVLNGKKGSGIISFILYLFITGFIEKLHNFIMDCFTSADMIGFTTGRMVYNLIYYIGFTVVMYVITAWIMDNKLSV